MENTVTIPIDRYNELLRKETQMDTIFAARSALPSYDFDKYMTCLAGILGREEAVTRSENDAE